MKIKKPRVEKAFSYSVVNIVLVVDQSCDERGVYTRLVSEYNLAYTDDDALSKFVSLLKKDPLKYYKRHFYFNASIVSRVFINPVSSDNYCFYKVPVRKGYVILRETTNLSINDLCKHTCKLTQYKSNIDSL